MAEPITERLRQCSPSRSTCVDAADIIERAYGLLWRDTEVRSGEPSQQARKLLLTAIGKEGQRRGISYAHDEFGPVSDAEAIRNLP